MDPTLLEGAEAPTAKADKLDAVRVALVEARNLSLEVADLETMLAEKKRRLVALQQRDLVDLFQSAHIDQLGIEPVGNQPGWDAKMRPFYHANIAADWDQARQAAGFKVLDQYGGGDLVKRRYVTSFGRGERSNADRFEALLTKHGFSFEVSVSVPWGTLTAWLREQVKNERKVPPLEPIGATVGHTVELKQRKAT